MTIYGLVGKSGTGKSFQAPEVCRSRGIPAIIDDGLFIYSNAVEAGHSAKRDENKMTAIKTAIFNNEEHRASVAQRIREVNPESILVLGTSEGMINKICSRLEIPEPSEMIHIEDIVDSDAIRTALRQRRELGKHVIPVPAVAIKEQFSGYLLMPLRMLRKRNAYKTENIEKSVVRPTYSYLGTFEISNKAVREIVEITCDRDEFVSEVSKCNVISDDDGVSISLGIICHRVENIPAHVTELQRRIHDAVDVMTAFNIKSTDIAVRGMLPRTRAPRRNRGRSNAV